MQSAAVLGTSHIIREVLQTESWVMNGGDSCWVKKRGSGERRSVTGHNKNNNNNNNNNRLSVKSQRLRRYKEATGRKQQNRLFTSNEKTYHPNLRSERRPDYLDTLLDKQDLTAFWASTWGKHS